MINQSCPLCGSSLYCVECLGKKEKCEHKFDHNENIKCVKNGFRFFQDELDDYTKQLSHIKQQAKQEFWSDMKPHVAYYQYHAVEAKEIKKKHGVE